MFLRQRGQCIVPNGVMDDPAPVFAHGFCKPRRGIAVAGAQFEHGRGADHACELIAVISTRRTDGREIIFLRVLFHLLHFRVARRHEGREVVLQFVVFDFGHEILLGGCRQVHK